jgi:hypothetical protein
MPKERWEEEDQIKFKNKSREKWFKNTKPMRMEKRKRKLNNETVYRKSIKFSYSCYMQKVALIAN